jgi:hypothetical protein
MSGSTDISQSFPDGFGARFAIAFSGQEPPARAIMRSTWFTALLATKFSPAMYKGQAAPSAFPIRISQTIQLR